MLPSDPELAAFYAPPPKTNGEAPPESKLDVYSFKFKAAIALMCMILEVSCYGILTWYYASNCTLHYGANTCFYAISKNWPESIINQPGVTWVKCYDTAGHAKFQAPLHAWPGAFNANQEGDVDDDDYARYERVLGCAAGNGDYSSDYYGDAKFSTPEMCCNGDISCTACSKKLTDCIPATFCHNQVMQCQWEICPGISMVVFSQANGAMAAIHVVFLYLVVHLCVSAFKLNKTESESISSGPANTTAPLPQIEHSNKRTVNI